MRIIHAPHAYAPALGGAENYCRELSESLAGFGCDVHVVTADISDAEAFYETGHSVAGPSNEEIGGVHVERIPYVNMLYRGAGLVSARGISHPGVDRRLIGRSTRRFCSRLRSAVTDLDPDVILALPHLFPNVRCLLAAAPGIPLVIAPMLHESDPNWPFDEVKEAVARADGVVALTPHEAERLIHAYGADPEHVAVVPPGIREIPEQAPATSDATVPRVVYAGRRSTTKNLNLLLQAMGRVWEVIPDAQLVIAGTSGDFDVSAQPAAHLGGQTERERIVTFDSPTDDELRTILSEGHVVVSPSLRESFGMVILEAWSVATPVVAIDTPVTRSIVSDGRDGILVEPSETQFADAVISLLDNPALAINMGLAGRAKALQSHAWDESARTLLALYERLT